MSRPHLLDRIGVHPAVLATASTHFVVDAYNNLYAPLLPLLIPKLGLSLAMAGTLAMCFQLASSVSQLEFGAIADRWRPRVLLVAGPILSVMVLSSVGLAGTPFALGIVLMIGGLGGAAFHPPAAALVHAVSSQRKGLAMSLHISGGSLGFSASPLVFAPAIAALGFGRSWVIALPGLLALALTLRLLPAVPRPVRAAGGGWAELQPYARPLTLLYLIVVLRTLAAYTFTTFMPVLLTSQGLSVARASGVVSLYLFSSTMGGLVGGPLADAYGARRLMVVTLLASVPFLTAAPLTSGWLMTALLAIGGFLLQSTLPVNVTYGQQVAPVSAATVSSLMMGFAWGTGALMVPIVGLMADRIGLPYALLSVALSPVLAAGVAAFLPHVASGTATPAHRGTTALPNPGTAELSPRITDLRAEGDPREPERRKPRGPQPRKPRGPEPREPREPVV
jgi:FSR family fosmidomycin resistance protein-like MFS transporter